MKEESGKGWGPRGTEEREGDRKENTIKEKAVKKNYWKGQEGA